jgi:hypothetical protein
MALADTALPFGLRDVKVAVLGAGDTPGTPVDFPNSRTMSFSEAEDTEELRGDDGVVAVHCLGASVDWELEGGGINFDAIKAMFGGTIEVAGVTPDAQEMYHKAETDARPYFLAEGQSISDAGGDFHVTLYKCKATGELSGEMGDGAFWLTGASGRAIGRVADRRVYTFTHNETETPIDIGA